ncbi:SpaN [Candidatus Regiella insecticola 5.15]|uniref:SpaN n=1 Tax=Candidatus Regiella insecticola 5.15 TaxID=1005043 RepID=G2H1X0_9ENTR|nr:type III secretion system needle length determinant, SpaN/EivJ family [Candidatus Regiella insecticola]EGY28008.1 SpaN [Candidatus Regiella insecticola 5.15]
MSQINTTHELGHSSQSVVGVTDDPYELASLFEKFQQKEEKEEKLLIFMEQYPQIPHLSSESIAVGKTALIKNKKKEDQAAVETISAYPLIAENTDRKNQAPGKLGLSGDLSSLMPSALQKNGVLPSKASLPMNASIEHSVNQEGLKSTSSDALMHLAYGKKRKLKQMPEVASFLSNTIMTSQPAQYSVENNKYPLATTLSSLQQKNRISHSEMGRSAKKSRLMPLAKKNEPSLTPLKANELSLTQFKQRSAEIPLPPAPLAAKPVSNHPLPGALLSKTGVAELKKGGVAAARQETVQSAQQAENKGLIPVSPDTLLLKKPLQGLVEQETTILMKNDALTKGAAPADKPLKEEGDIQKSEMMPYQPVNHDKAQATLSKTPTQSQHLPNEMTHANPQPSDMKQAENSGTVYRFQRWGKEHSVNITQQADSSKQANTQWVLQPSSPVVEQRLESHLQQENRAGHWTLVRDDEQQKP